MKKIIVSVLAVLTGLLCLAPAQDAHARMTAVVQNESDDPEALSHLAISNDFKGACLDPDVLVLCPVTRDISDRKDKGPAKTGREVAEFLDGTCTVCTDQTNDGTDPLRTVLSGGLSNEYGTVILTTHSGIKTYADGTSCLTWYMYARKGKKEAQKAFRDLVSEYGIPENRIEDLTVEPAVINAHWWLQLGYDPDKKVYVISLSSEYVREIYADAWFPNTVFFFCSCSSGADSVFNSFLLGQGAAAVIGFQYTFSSYIADNVCKHLFSQMCRKNTGESTADHFISYSVGEALDLGYNFGWEGLMNALNLFGYGLLWATDPDTYDSPDDYLNSVYSYSHAGVYGCDSFVYYGTGTLQGAVRDLAGVPASHVSVELLRLYDGRLVPVRKTETDENGRYSFSKLSYGLYLVKAAEGENKSYITAGLDAPDMEAQDIILYREQKGAEAAGESLEQLLTGHYWSCGIQSPQIIEFIADGSIVQYQCAPDGLRYNENYVFAYSHERAYQSAYGTYELHGRELTVYRNYEGVPVTTTYLFHDAGDPAPAEPGYDAASYVGTMYDGERYFYETGYTAVPGDPFAARPEYLGLLARRQ